MLLQLIYLKIYINIPIFEFKIALKITLKKFGVKIWSTINN